MLKNFCYGIRLHARKFSKSPFHHGLDEFFDVPDNWNKTDIKHGRAWMVEELRIKSNQDLHKLWFVLYKEKNMLLTMETEYKRIAELFPSPERIDKVEESMANLESVVKERNKAVNLLEKGVTGEREGKVMWHPLGVKVYRESNEWPIPYELNEEEKAKGYKEYMVANEEILPFWQQLREKHRTLQYRKLVKRAKEKKQMLALSQD